MAYDFGSFDATIAVAAGDDRALFAELRKSFVISARGHLDLLSRARCDGNWQVAAMRLHSLAASFQMIDLMELCNQALEGAPGDPANIRQLARLIDAIDTD